jgi:hypothetical protein
MFHNSELPINYPKIITLDGSEADMTVYQKCLFGMFNYRLIESSREKNYNTLNSNYMYMVSDRMFGNSSFLRAIINELYKVDCNYNILYVCSTGRMTKIHNRLFSRLYGSKAILPKYTTTNEFVRNCNSYKTCHFIFIDSVSYSPVVDKRMKETFRGKFILELSS